jgi:hypothetical protein
VIGRARERGAEEVHEGRGRLAKSCVFIHEARGDDVARDQAGRGEEAFCFRDCFEGSIRGQMEALLAELSESFGGDVKVFGQNRNVLLRSDRRQRKATSWRASVGSFAAMNQS